MPKIRKKLRSNRIKLNIKKIMLLICILLTVFGIGVAQSKYKSSTLEQVITLITKYHVNYQTVGGKIHEPEKFNSYVSQTGLVLPVEGEVTRVRYDFQGWYNNNNYTGSPITEIASGEQGDKLFFAAWNVSQYTLKMQVKHSEDSYTNGLPDDWNLVIGKDEQGNDNVITLDDNGEIIVGKGETVSLRTRYSPDIMLTGLTIDDDIVFTERYETGDQYIYYDFTMPRHNVTAIFGEEDGYIDLAKSPITFEENVDVGSIPHNGFWYKSSIKGMVPLKNDPEKGNFYDWDNSEPFYVTSNGVATQNQLTIVNAMKVYLKDVNLIETETFSSNASGKRFVEADIVSGNSVGDISSYANILYKYNDHISYTSYLYFVGRNNKVNAILPNAFNWANAYGSTLYIYGATSDRNENSVELGTVMGNYDVNYYSLTINELENDFDLLIFTNRSPNSGNIQFSNCILNAPSKWIYGKGQGVYYTNSKVDIGTVYAYASFSISGNSYVRVRENVVSGYGTASIGGSSSFVVDGSFRPAYSHATAVTSISTNGFVIVKGNMFEGTNLKVTKGVFIANVVAIGRTCSLTGGTIITNQILQSPAKYPAYSKSAGTYVFTGTPSSSYGVVTSKNDDNLPFATYSQSDSTEGEYLISGSKIYLLGYYKTIEENNNKWLDTSVDLSTTENNLRYLVYGKENTDLPVLLDENGDLVSNPSIANVNLEEFVDNYGTSSTETIIIGNSTYIAGQAQGRTVSITGGKIYSAGNITFFNDTSVTGGNIITAGTFSTKRDFNISGNANINSSIIGNKNAITITENGLKRYAKTTISGGEIVTDKIGAVDANSYSNVTIGTSTINSKDSDNIDIQSDTYINYFADNTVYNADTSDTTLRFNGNITEGTNKTIDDANMQLPGQRSFSAPIVISDGTSGLWAYNDLNGEIINYVDINGKVNGSTDNGLLYQLDKISLYAVKGSYNLYVKEGLEYISSVLVNNNTVDITSGTAAVTPNGTVELNINDSSMLDKIVIWYIDGNNVVHNANPTINTENSKVVFNMPYADTEIYITNTMTLNLNKYSITFTDTGFYTEFGEENDGTYTFSSDSKFAYSGDYIINHSEITRVNVSSSARYIATPITSTPTGKSTSNKVHFLNNFNNTGEDAQTITITKLIQSGSTSDSYFKMEDGAKAEILIDGSVQVYLVEVPENSDIIFKGVHGDRSDALYAKANGTINNSSVGNKNGKAGNITYKDLKIITKSSANGTLGYSYTKTTKTLKFENCILDRDQWYSSSGIARYYENVIFDNSDFLINMSNSWPGAIFTGITNVKIINGSTFNYLYGCSSTEAVTLFNNTSSSSTLEVIDSDINITTRRSTASTAYRERHATTTLFKNVILSGSSHLTADQKIYLRNLTVNDNSKITIDSGNGYLFAQNITINGGEINTGYILVSGFYAPTTTNVGSEAKTVDALYTALNAGTLVLNGSSYNGLVINAGTINASKFIGGDKNAKVNINGGIVNTKAMGTSGKLYGYISTMSKTGEDYVYSMDKIPSTGTVVNINSGTVNVLANGYLGGMNATVNVNGGNVNLAQNALIGINETDTTTMVNNITSQGNTPSELVDINIKGGTITGSNGLINTPYSTVTIDGTSSNPSIDIEYIKAEDGTINIESTANHYNNPLGSGERVGTIIEDTIIAKNITIDNGAVVYSKVVTSKTNKSTEEGNITVGENSYLYTEHYGTEGAGTSTITINGTIVGNRQYSIQYVMNDTYADSASNPNPPSYIAGIGLELSEPTRFGYTFEGWYDNEENKITEITSTETGDKVLNARWIADEVEFVVRIKAEDLEISKEEFAEEVDLSLGSLNATGDTFTYTEHAKVGYHELMNTGLLLSKYNLASYAASAARIDNDTLNPDEDILNLTSNGSTITREIMEYYLNNDSTPISINVCEFVHT